MSLLWRVTEFFMKPEIVFGNSGGGVIKISSVSVFQRFHDIDQRPITILTLHSLCR